MTCVLQKYMDRYPLCSSVVSTLISLFSASGTYDLHIFFLSGMAHEVEDEVDWSDGTIDDPPITFTGASEDSGYVSLNVHNHDGLDYLFEPQEEDEYEVPLGTALPPSMPCSVLMSHQLIGYSSSATYCDTSSVRPYRCAPQSSPTLRARLCALRSVPSQSEGVRSYLS